MDFTIRRARAQEYEEIGELTAQTYLDDGLLTYGAADPYLAQLRDTTDRAAHAELLVAVRDAPERIVQADTGPAVGAILGTVTFAVGGAMAQVAGPAEGEFRMLAVHPAARGRGVGEALVRECLDRARAQGMSRVVLSSDRLMTTAHRLYERLGFSRTPSRDWEPIPDCPLWTFAVDLSTPEHEGHNI